MVSPHVHAAGDLGEPHCTVFTGKALMLLPNKKAPGADGVEVPMPKALNEAWCFQEH